MERNKKKETALVYDQQMLAEGIYDMWITTSLAREARAGQFISVYPRDSARLLPRPISICETDREGGRLRIVYRVSGKGTEEFSHYTKGQPISILGILGNGFPVEKAAGKKVFLMGGGIGIPPMLQLAKELAGDGKDQDTQKGGLNKNDIRIIAGFRDDRLFLHEDLAKYGSLTIASEDGSVGTKGNVLDAVRSEGLRADLIYACGPMPMLRAIKKYAEEQGIDAYISLEERMACGVGACLGCVVKTTDIDRHSHVHNARICTDGPVYLAKEVDI